VTAEDDSTKEVYEVIFSMDKPQDKIEPFNAEPVITQIVSKQFWHNNYIEITNPGNRPIDLSNYLIGVGGGGDNPATVISGTSNNFNRRYERYVPGYQYQSEVEWNSKAGIIEKDLLVNPVLQPGESFVVADIARNLDDVTEEQWDACDVIITSGNWSPVEDVRERADCRVIEEPNHNYVVAFGKPDLQINLYKITNDSIKEGTKGIGDPADFELVDAFGDYSGNFWTPTGVEVDKFVRVDRKSAYWEPDALPGVSGSWGDSEETSEWIVTDRDDLQAMGSPWDSNGGRLYLAYGIGFHAFDPVSVFKSTVTSFKYKVSDGYESPQTIEGILTGTTLSEFLADIDKAHEDQALKLLGVDGTVRSDGDELANEDTLKVTSADSSNTTRYVLSVTADGLDSDAVLTSSEYTVDYADSTGTISGIAMGTPVEEVRNNVTKPETATLNIINDGGNLVPLQQRNFDTVYVNTQATSDIFFEVVAEDGETIITYQLQLDIGNDEAYIMSDMYDVDQELNLISLIPQSTNVETFFKHAKANEGASVKMVDKIGHERTQGAISFDDEVIVTSPDSSTEKIYYLKFQQEKSGSEAFVVSDVLGIDQALGEIWGIQSNSQINIFLGLITPAPDATVDVLDADSAVVETGELGDGYMLKVTSGDSLSQKVYDLYFSDEKPGTGAYVTSKL